jgi:hypothetical protein
LLWLPRLVNSCFNPGVHHSWCLISLSIDWYSKSGINSSIIIVINYFCNVLRESIWQSRRINPVCRWAHLGEVLNVYNIFCLILYPWVVVSFATHSGITSWFWRNFLTELFNLNGLLISNWVNFLIYDIINILFSEINVWDCKTVIRCLLCCSVFEILKLKRQETWLRVITDDSYLILF